MDVKLNKTILNTTEKIEEFKKNDFFIKILQAPHAQSTPPTRQNMLRLPFYSKRSECVPVLAKVIAAESLK